MSCEESPKDDLEILLDSINNQDNKSIPSSPRFEEIFYQFEQPDLLINPVLPVLPKTNLVSNFPKELPKLEELISPEFGKDLLEPKFATTTTSRSSKFSIVDGTSENVFDSKTRSSSSYHDPMRLGVNFINIYWQLLYTSVIRSFYAQCPPLNRITLAIIKIITITE